MHPDKQVKDWIVDAALFAGFLAAMWMDLTGLAVHQWLGLLMGAACAYHLRVHRQWVSTVTRRILKYRNNQVRRLWLLDLGVLVGMGVTLLTGLVISTWLALPLSGYALWRNAHVIASIATLVVVVAKIGAHWRWIMTVAQKKVVGVRPALPKGGSQTGGAGISRREFLGLMAAAGGLALLAGAKPLLSTMTAQAASQVDLTASAVPPAQAASPVDATASAVPSSLSSAAQAASSVDGTASAVLSSQTAAAQAEEAASATCQIRCGNRCSYPGRCHRYTDTNGNQRCDLGECLS
jgi:hypothetical protein